MLPSTIPTAVPILPVVEGVVEAFPMEDGTVVVAEELAVELVVN